MCEPLHVRGFKWMTEEEMKNWEDIPCILEVGMEYPEGLHNLQYDYPLAPESVTVNRVEKLGPNLNAKSCYVIHDRNLKNYLSLGTKLKSIRRGIDLLRNTHLRTKAKNNFEKDFFKLMNNSVFGKTMENIRSRVDVRLVNNRRAAEKLAEKQNFKHLSVFDENLVAIHMKRTKLVFDKPVYCGMSILDSSKTLMYDFQYNYVKKHA